MSAAWAIGLGVWFVASGSAGFERYMLEKRAVRAILDVGVSVIGMILIVHGIEILTGTPTT